MEVNMKRVFLLFNILSLFFLIIGCASETKENLQQELAKPVQVMQVKPSTVENNLEYIATIDAVEIKRYSFKLPGKITEIYKEIGQVVLPREILAQQDTKDMELALRNGQYNLQKIQKAFEFQKDTFNKTEALFEAGAISKQDYDKVKLEMNSLEQDLNNARLDIEGKINSLRDSKIISEDSGTIADVMYKEGEFAGGGVPVFIIRSDSLKAVLGISQQDFGKIFIGQNALVSVNGIEAKGSVSYIHGLPDSQTRTYKVEVALENKTFPIGALAKALIELDKEEGFLIPITSILTNGEDYVFVVNGEDKAEKRKVVLGSIKGSQVLVQGLNTGDRLVTKGMKRVKEGDKLLIQ